MRGRFKVLFFFLLELLEFSEDRNRWESVEEKLNAIRYEFFAFVVCFYRSFIRPSFRPLVALSLEISVLTSLLAPSPFLHILASPPPTSLVHCFPIFVSSLPSLFFTRISPSFDSLDPTSTHSTSFAVPFSSFSTSPPPPR